MNDVVEVEDEHLSIRKSVVGFNTDSMTGIEFTITSHADVPVQFRLVEDLPEGVSTSDIGLNPDYHSASWSTFPEENRLVFQDRIWPDDELVTLWGVQTNDPLDIESLLTEPRIEVNVLAEEEAESSTSTDRGSQPGSEENLKAFWEAESNQNAARSTDPSGASPNNWEADSARAKQSRSLVHGLVEEIQSGGVDDEELDMLRDALAIDTPESLRIRTRWLQSQVSDLIAYSEELEGFIDEKGSPSELVEEFEAEIQTLHSRLDTIETHQEEADERLVTARERIAAVEQTSKAIDNLKDELHRLQYQLEELETVPDDDPIERIDGLETKIDAALGEIRDDVNGLTEEVEDFKEWRDRLADLLGSLGTSSE